jgi:hypothetical protein
MAEPVHLRAYGGAPGWGHRRGGKAIGGRVLGRRRARHAQRCECCPCRISAGAWVYEVLRAEDVVWVCDECVGPW